MTDYFVKHIDRITSKDLLNKYKEKGYIFPCGDMTLDEVINYFYTYNHGNSTLLFDFYYNDITNKNEITIMNIATKNSYPQLKKLPINYYWGELK